MSWWWTTNRAKSPVAKSETGADQVPPGLFVNNNQVGVNQQANEDIEIIDDVAEQLI